MNTQMLTEQFERMGARLRFAALLDTFRPGTDRVQIDVNRDRKGDYFELRTDPARPAELTVLDERPDDRRLLLTAERSAFFSRPGETRETFLCGHGDQGWFVTSLPDHLGVTDLESAMDVIKPVILSGDEAEADPAVDCFMDHPERLHEVASLI